MGETARYELNTPDVVSDVLDDEAVIVNLDTGMYFRAVGDACGAWTAIIGGADTSSVDGAAREEFEAFMALLAEHDLIRPRADDPPSTEAVPPVSPGSLTLESHADLQDLLALDPVHDVESAAGWPEQPAG